MGAVNSVFLCDMQTETDCSLIETTELTFGDASDDWQVQKEKKLFVESIPAREKIVQMPCWNETSAKV